MKIVVSACLLGENCKYNGGNNRNEALIRNCWAGCLSRGFLRRSWTAPLSEGMGFPWMMLSAAELKGPWKLQKKNSRI